MAKLFASSGDPDQTPHSQHTCCLPFQCGTLSCNGFVAPPLAWANKTCKFPSVRPCTYISHSVHPGDHPKWSLQIVKQLISLHWLFYLTELNKYDNSHSSGACFHILVRRCDINFRCSFVCSVFEEISLCVRTLCLKTSFFLSSVEKLRRLINLVHFPPFCQGRPLLGLPGFFLAC